MTRHLGNLTYRRKDHVVADPACEASRQELMSEWRRIQVRALVLAHLRRIVRQDGLSQSLEGLYDRDGNPPPNISLRKLMRQYRVMRRQQGWLEALVDELRQRMKALDLVRYHSDMARLQAELRRRREQREGMLAAAMPEGVEEGQLPSKLRALIRKAVELEIQRKEARNVISIDAEEFDLNSARKAQTVMRYLFFEHVRTNREKIPTDPAAQYEYLFRTATEFDALVLDLRANIYELEEFIESADYLATRDA